NGPAASTPPRRCSRRRSSSTASSPSAATPSSTVPPSASSTTSRQRIGPRSHRWGLGATDTLPLHGDYMEMSKRFAAEFLGTFWLVLGGCGSAVLAAAFPGVGIGLLGVSFAFGFTVLTMAFAIGHISGCHLNPAVSLGLWAGRRFPANELLPYIIAQVLGGAAGAGALYVIASGKP